MSQRKLSKTQRVDAWRIARRFLAHHLHGNDGFRGTDGMTKQLRTLHVGRRLGERIFHRCSQMGAMWIERGIGLISRPGHHCGKIASCECGVSGWKVMPQGNTFTVFAAIGTPSKRVLHESIGTGFADPHKATTWALSAEGQVCLRTTFLKVKP